MCVEEEIVECSTHDRNRPHRDTGHAYSVLRIELRPTSEMNGGLDMLTSGE